MALSGASCNQKSAANPDEAGERRELVQAIDQVEGTSSSSQAAKSAPSAPANQEPLPGVDVSALDDKKRERFYRLIDQTLQSPCGKAHSLRKSLTSDTECKRALFAVRYVTALLDDEATDKDIQHYYENHYKASEPRAFEFSNTPYTGAPDAPVQVVEFYDYGCPACKEVLPILKEALEGYGNQVAMYYKQFPLPSHTHSKPAAQAALAAQKQGKFEPMHELLFANAHRHEKADLLAHAGSLGLDVAKFEADYEAAASVVEAHIQEGDASGVRATPTFFINGHVYEGPMHPRYIKLWIDEELAVNR